MYKSRAVPTLSGDNAEYFREIQEKMEHAESQTDWQSVGEGVIAMMKKAGSEAWGIWAKNLVDDAVNHPKVMDFYARNQFWPVFKTEENEREANELEEGEPLMTRFMIADLKV